MVEGAFVSSPQDHAGCIARRQRFEPAGRTQAPAVAGPQAGKAELGHSYGRSLEQNVALHRTSTRCGPYAEARTVKQRIKALLVGGVLALALPVATGLASCGRRYRKATVVRDYLFLRQTKVAKYFNRTP